MDGCGVVALWHVWAGVGVPGLRSGGWVVIHRTVDLDLEATFLPNIYPLDFGEGLSKGHVQQQV
jgi:hypothetical protein